MIIGKKVLYYPEIDSTNEEAKRLIERGYGEGTVVWAGGQTKGRGKPGNYWFSPANVGCYFSAIVKPYRNPKDLIPITILGAEAAICAIRKISGVECQVELPNDIVVGGKKIGGVLVERVVSGFLIIGIGININNEENSFPEEITHSATSLRIHTGKTFEIKKFIELLISELDHRYLEYLKKV